MADIYRWACLDCGARGACPDMAQAGACAQDHRALSSHDTYAHACQLTGNECAESTEQPHALSLVRALLSGQLLPEQSASAH